MNVLIDLSPSAIAEARRLAAAAGVSRKAWIEQTIEQATGTAAPEMVLATWPVATTLDSFTCADCAQEFGAAMFYGVTDANRIIGPLCAICARGD
jgi:hypothetical protein